MFETIAPPPNRLIVFARLPEAGKVKTRLARDLGDDRALAVYQAMLRDLFANLGASTEELDIEILWAPTEAANGAALHAAFNGYPLAMQTGDTLGDRLCMAFSERFFFQRTQKVVAIGADEPALTRALIDDAFNLLESVDWVVGPASDGGYYLIGCRAAAFDPAIFDGIDWGSDRVLAQTLAKIRTTVAMLPLRNDIDVIDDLRAYAGGGALAALLQEWELR
ncbi:MAG TPA: TIGR04282 family arsenosugar biosynthesis glycosyltransferase [Thermoanaerobaculia bacterium]|nr:TIGR04282 family arsenosugar biosynthesis glycosyltransferase [Thermoanaerobaculia bacterium]